MPQDKPSLFIPRRGQSVVLARPQSTGDLGSDFAQMQADTSERAHQQAIDAGGFMTTNQRKGRKFGGGPVDPAT